MNLFTRLWKQRRRIRKRILKTMNPFFMGLSIIGFLLMLPILFPLAMIAMARDNRLKRAAVEKFHCLRCGFLLGAVALQLADREWGRQMEKMHADNPHSMLRMNRTLWAICPVCGLRYTYSDNTRIFTELSE